MKCTDAQADDIKDKITAENNGQQVTVAVEPEDPQCYFVESYTLGATYRQELDQWAKNLGSAPFSTQSFRIDQGSSHSWSEGGHEETSASAKVRARGLFRFAGGGAGGSISSSKDWTRSELQLDENEVTFTLQWKAMGLFNISPGTWNFGDLINKYPQSWQDPSMPTRDVNLVRIKSLLCASGWGLTVEFTGESKRTFDEEIRKQSQSSGNAGFHIGCFGFSAGFNKSTSSTNETHDVNWAKADGKLTFSSILPPGSCNLLALVGEREKWFQVIN